MEKRVNLQANRNNTTANMEKNQSYRPSNFGGDFFV